MINKKNSTSLPTLSDKIRILVIGDSSVGKTSIIHLICKDKIIQNIPSTIGCNIEVKLYEYNNKYYFIEFMDIGGKTKYENTRQLFYSQMNGILLVYDLTNKNSYLNLKKWINEILFKIKSKETFKWKIHENLNKNNFNTEDLLEIDLDDGISLPILIIGNKEDLIDNNSNNIKNFIIDETAGKILQMSALNPNTFLNGSPAYYKLTTFFNKIIQSTFFSNNAKFSTIMESPRTKINQKDLEIQIISDNYYDLKFE